MIESFNYLMHDTLKQTVTRQKWNKDGMKVMRRFDKNLNLI